MQQYRASISKAPKSNAPSNDLYAPLAPAAPTAPNIFDGFYKKKENGSKTAHAKYRPRLKQARDTAAANQYKSFEGLPN